MKNENQESLDPQNKDSNADHSNPSAQSETNKTQAAGSDGQNQNEETNPNRKDPSRQSDQEEKEASEDIDYSDFDIDESTGGSAMGEAENG